MDQFVRLIFCWQRSTLRLLYGYALHKNQTLNSLHDGVVNTLAHRG